jgi:UDP-N-acetylglucosamine 1-carboxyvinyltransferase
MEGSSEHDARLKVRGGRRLEGEVTLSGAKNSALKLLAASLLTTDPCVIRRVPRITDVATMVTMLRALGAHAEGEGDVLRVHAGAGLSGCAPYELVRTMRASIIVMGPLVARLGEATIAMPGGCNIGPRRIDFHIRGLEKLGAHIDIDHGFIRVHSDGLKGAVVPLDYPSVGATENLVMAATAAEGETVIENAAREPEIMDLCAFLSGMGAEIEGAGTSTIHIAGGRPLHGVDHAVIADRVEAGTYLLMGAATSGRVTTVGLDPAHLELFLAKLRAMGVHVEEGEERITVSRDGPLAPVDISTLPHPGFATDLQAQTMVLLSLAEGTSIITENVFENRFVVVDELNRLGAGIETSGHHAVIAGPRGLSGTVVEAPDLRGGAALVTAGLVADGLTEVRSVYHIDRGYEDLTGKLRKIGADVSRAGERPRTEPETHASLKSCADETVRSA